MSLRCPVSPRLGIIGGSGLYQSGLLDRVEIIPISTPFGEPSSPLEMGTRCGQELVFLTRHGPGHTIPPHHINHKANLHAMKDAEVDRVVSTSSVGSLKKRIKPGGLIVPDDYICPWEIPTYDEGVIHVTPQLDPSLRLQLLEAAGAAGVPVHEKGRIRADCGTPAGDEG